MRPDRSSPQIRARLEELIKAYSTSYAAMSRMLGHEPAWLRKVATTEKLHEMDPDERGRLARFFGVEEWELGGPGER